MGFLSYSSQKKQGVSQTCVCLVGGGGGIKSGGDSSGQSSTWPLPLSVNTVTGKLCESFLSILSIQKCLNRQNKGNASNIRVNSPFCAGKCTAGKLEALFTAAL